MALEAFLGIVFQFVEHHLWEPERVPDVHVSRTSGDAKILDTRVVGSGGVEHVVEIGRRQIGIRRRI